MAFGIDEGEHRARDQAKPKHSDQPEQRVCQRKEDPPRGQDKLGTENERCCNVGHEEQTVSDHSCHNVTEHGKCHGQWRRKHVFEST